MAVPLKYNWRSLWVRWRSTAATVLSMGLVVGVFVMVLALAHGLTATYLETGDARNLIVFRKGSLAESSSQITLEEVRRTRYLDGIERDAQGEPRASAEMIILITLPRQSGGKAHVQVRGVGPQGLGLRPQMRLTQGRMFRPGMRECVVSENLARRFADCQLEARFRSGKTTWHVVGLFEADQTAYDSEIWVDVDEAREAFNRAFYSSLLVRTTGAVAAEGVVERIEVDPLMRLRAVPEPEYFREQTKTAQPIRVLGLGLAVLMSLGAAFAAMNTLYASVAARAREIGTLRVLGFRPATIYWSFMLESLMVAALGGVVGCLLALPLHGIATGTFNWATFAEVAFEFRITPGLLAGGLGFALLMGAVGGALPARRAARKPLLAALRAE
ncbi:MAG: ABC transporter permease [Verrucomicrobia bacterium]|nr:ABC transporter permease [Verrucomicrobiota bacterium]